jgi:hypothetical protein
VVLSFVIELSVKTTVCPGYCDSISENSVPSEDILTLGRLDRGSIAMWSMSQQGIEGALNNTWQNNNMKIVQQLLPCLGEFL